MIYLICEWTIDSLKNICRDYHSRIERLEDEKYDFEFIVKGKDYQVHFLKLQTISRQQMRIFFNSKCSFSNYFFGIFIFWQSLMFHFNQFFWYKLFIFKLSQLKWTKKKTNSSSGHVLSANPSTNFGVELSIKKKINADQLLKLSVMIFYTF